MFQEQKRGASDARPTRHTCLEDGRAGDPRVVTRLDRRARSTRHLCQVVADLARQPVHLQGLAQHLDPSDAPGRLGFHLLGAMAQFETAIRAERPLEGIRKARERGVDVGRKRHLTMPQVTRLRQRRPPGARINTLMTDDGLSQARVYRSLSDPSASSVKPG
jgi:DNA invertase Pin-like site-specific DNA recombinase